MDVSADVGSVSSAMACRSGGTADDRQGDDLSAHGDDRATRISEFLGNVRAGEAAPPTDAGAPRPRHSALA
ncbi:hypothetical protein NML43_20130 [Rhodopseudomonas palustris]|uniref:hypothetical protein n=1 Tax=Rhodopseudomonas palustris TaxID=1076 RepID=UPI0020CF6C22|nr:hypothetical protein [Rhodopseudomonas palustris]MCP9629407.1 hypothetical protein [Rhodopseudomonas palustris]